MIGVKSIRGWGINMYTLTLSQMDVDTIGWVGNRYGWSDALSRYDVGTHHIPEHEAWAIYEAIEADMDGGHNAFPLLNSYADLATKLADFYLSIV